MLLACRALWKEKSKKNKQKKLVASEHVPVLLAALYAATKTLIDTYAQMLDAGKVTDLEQLLTFDQFNALVGMEEKLQYEEKYGRGEGQEKLHVKVPGLSRPIWPGHGPVQLSWS